MPDKLSFKELEKRVRALEKESLELKCVEQALRESEQLHRLTLSNISDAVFITDDSGNFTYICSNVNVIFGYSFDEVAEFGNISALLGDDFVDRKELERLGEISNTEKTIKDKVYKEHILLVTVKQVSIKGGSMLYTCRDITERKHAEETQLRYTHDLGERVKELNCLYSISKIIDRPDISPEDIFQEVVNIIPPSWQYPETTCARIVYEEKTFETENFEKTRWLQSAEIKKYAKSIGSVEVYYLEQMPDSYEGPFLKEERDLIGAIAERLGGVAERKEEESAVQTLVATMAGSMGQEFFDTIVSNLCEWLSADCAIVGEISGEGKVYACSIKLDGKFINNYSYPLKGSPCESAVEKGYCFYMDGVARLFPHDKALVEMEAKGYVGTPLKDRKGKAIGILCAISSRKLNLPQKAKEVFHIIAAKASMEIERSRAEKEQKISLSLIKATLESTADGILVVDSERKITNFNQMFQQMWHIPDDIVASMDDEKVLAFILDQSKEPDIFISKVRELYIQPEATSFDVLAFTDGRTFERYSQPQRIEEKIAGRVWSFRDVTEKERAQEALKEAKEEAESATIIKDKFVSLVSHDLKAPITTISLYLQLLCDRTFDLDTNQSMYKELLDICDDMTTLINELLSLSKIKSGGIKPQFVFIDAKQIASTVIKKYSMLAKGKGIKLSNEIPEKTRIYVDKMLFLQVIDNLVSNAVKFCSRGDAVRIHSQEEEPSTIAVTDTGNGIEEDRIKNLFKYEAKTSTRGTSGEIGTGLGLPMVYDIMKAHKGDVYLDSTLGKGSTFYVKLPQVRPNILIIDDDQHILNLLKKSLKVIDAEFFEALNAEIARELIETNPLHLILLDIMMPDEDGFELLKYIRSNAATKVTPVIVITADSTAETHDRAFQMGADDFVLKPFNIDDLIPIVRRFVG